MLPIAFLLVVPFAFAQAFFTRNLPTMSEQFGQVRATGETLRTYGGVSTLVLGVVRTLVLAPLATAALLRIIVGAFVGEDWGASRALRASWRRLGSLVWAIALTFIALLGLFMGVPVVIILTRQSNDFATAIAVVVALALGVIAFIAIYRWIFVGAAVVLEGCRGRKALRRSWEISNGFFWKIVGNLFVLSLLVGVISGVLVVIPQEIARANDGAWWLLTGVGSTIALTLLTPVLTVATTLLYLHCRVVQEHLTLEALEHDVDRANPEPGEPRILPEPRFG